MQPLSTIDMQIKDINVILLYLFFRLKGNSSHEKGLFLFIMTMFYVNKFM